MPLGQAGGSNIDPKDLADLLRLLQQSTNPSQTPRVPSADSLGGDSFGTSARS